jgi:hypothetical protein
MLTLNFIKTEKKENNCVVMVLKAYSLEEVVISG